MASAGRHKARQGDERRAWLLVAPGLAALAAFYFYPVAQVLWISVTEPAPGFGNYALLVTNGTIHRVLMTTLRICALTAFLAVVLGYLIAYVLASAGPRRRRWLLLGLVLPLWVSALVRAFAWVTLLRRNGIVNTLLLDLGVTATPLELVWNEFGVVIAMVHYMLPYAALPLYASLREIDRRTIAAARGLGASRFQAFRLVFLPQSVPGIVGAGMLVFVYSLGFFVIPAILGGGKTLMIAEFIRLQIVEILRWGTGTMLATVLILIVFMLLAIVARCFGLRRIFGGAGTA